MGSSPRGRHSPPKVPVLSSTSRVASLTNVLRDEHGRTSAIEVLILVVYEETHDWREESTTITSMSQGVTLGQGSGLRFEQLSGGPAERRRRMITGLQPHHVVLLAGGPAARPPSGWPTCSVIRPQRGLETGRLEVDPLAARDLRTVPSGPTYVREPAHAQLRNASSSSPRPPAGHVRAAQAIEKAFEQSGRRRGGPHIDALEYTNKVFRSSMAASIELVNATPDLFGWLYDHLDKPGTTSAAGSPSTRLNTRPFVKMLQEYQPDIAVCTHFLPAEIISWLRAKERLNVPAGHRGHRL